MGSYTQTDGSSTPTSTTPAPRFSSLLAGTGQTPPARDIPAWISNLQTMFRAPSRQQPSPAPAAPRSYEDMVRQALPGGWQAPAPAYTPPAPPAAAPAPAVETPTPTMANDWSSRSGMDANVTAPGYKRGGLVPPTEAQKHAGNYQKKHISFHGLQVAIENPKGSTRSGKDANGKTWSCVMPADYGYIKRTEGADGDHVDVFIGPEPASKMVFVINQNDHRTGQFDEHKVMLGYSSERSAVADYVKAFNDGKGADRIRSVEPMSLDAFKHWLKRGRTKTPAKSKSIVEHALAMTRSKQ